MHNIDKTVANATKWSMITEVIAKLITPVVNMILARILLPEAFGAVATITMVISFAEIFTDAGFQKYIIQHEFSSEQDFDESANVAFWTNFTLSAIIVMIIVIFRHQIANLVGSPDLSTGISVASFSIVIVAFSSIQMAVYRRNFQFKTLFFVRIITSLIPLFVTLPLAVLLRNFWALTIGTLCMNFVQAVILTVRSRWKPRIYYSLPKFKEMFSFTSWTLLETISIWLTSYIGTFIVGRSLDDYYLGLYKTSMTTVNSYMGIITAGLTPVLFSALSRYQNDETKFQETYFNFQKLTAIFLMPMGFGLYIYRDLVVQILLGNQWTEASGFVGLWGLMSSMTIVLSHFASEVYRSKGKPKISLFSQLLHLCFLVPTLLISVNYGFNTLYISRSLVRIQGILSAMIISDIIFKIKIKETLKNIFPQTLCALLMGISTLLTRGIFPGTIWQFVSIGICVIVYFGILMLFPSMRKTVFELEIVKKLRSKL